MSSFNEVLCELYPLSVLIPQTIPRRKLVSWCVDNGIVEWDIGVRCPKNAECYFWVLRLAHMDDWILAKIMWA